MALSSVMPTLLVLAFAAVFAQATLTTLNPAENKRSYSSVYDDDAVGGHHARSMIGSDKAWSAKTNAVDQFMIINLGSVMAVKGVVTQGHADPASSAQYVKTFKVEHSQDGSNWVKVTGTYGAGKQSTKVQAIFPAAVQAQYVKISVKSWNTHISMRAGVVLTQADSSAVLARKLKGHGGATSSSKRSTVTTVTTTVPTKGTTGATTTGTTGTTGATTTGTTGGGKGTTGTTGKAGTTGTTGTTGDPTKGTTGGGKGTTGTTGKAGTTGTTGTTGGGKDTTVTFSGSMSLKITGTNVSQVEIAVQMALAKELAVENSEVSVTAKESRRLADASPRQLEGNWAIGFEVTVPAAKSTAIESKVTALKSSTATLTAELKVQLKAAGVDDAAIAAMEVSLFKWGTTGTTGTTGGVWVEQTAAASALFFPTMATILAVGAQLMF